MTRPPVPPFNAETAAQKARIAEDAWQFLANRSRLVATRRTAAGGTERSLSRAARRSKPSLRANGPANLTTA